ncbi:hypothetical protein [Rhodovulum sulfidophilum]|uniref:hypothetical protein n=1 Tax=Rhodovulum sulfidophilum TaxID=35806 RepID=UPI0019149B4E|nr:hypothetical protein [Rhodovulum sulfidophilum]
MVEPQATRPTVSGRPTPMPHRMRPPPMGWPRSDAAPWHRLSARSRGRKAEAEIKDLPDRLFSHRFRGNSFELRQSHIFVAIAEARNTLSSGITGRTERWRLRNFSEIPAAARPYRIHIALTDQAIGTPLIRMTMAHGVQLANRPQDRRAMAQFPDGGREEPRVEHRLEYNHLELPEKQSKRLFFKRRSDRGVELLGRGR